MRNYVVGGWAIIAIALSCTAVNVRAGQSMVEELKESCSEGWPYVALSLTRNFSNPEQPSIVFQRDTSVWPEGIENDNRMTAALFRDTGPVFGLAYDLGRSHLYTAAFRAKSEFGGDRGVGEIYRIDLSTQEVASVHEIPAGNARWPTDPLNDPAGETVGLVGIGDIDIDQDADVLAAANLYSGQIHTMSLPDLAPVSVFDNGWGASRDDRGRLFGLGVYENRLYHGVVVMSEGEDDVDNLVAKVYESEFDGTALREVLSTELNYIRSPVWRRWRGDLPADFPPRWSEPVFADIEFDHDGNMILGFQDRRQLLRNHFWGAGDILRATRGAGRTWRVEPGPEYYDDEQNPRSISEIDEFAIGSLATSVDRRRVISGRTWLVPGGSVSALQWLSNGDGQIRGARDGIEMVGADGVNIGDIEVMCSKTVRGTSTPTATPNPSPAPTKTALSTSTAKSSATPGRVYLPIALREECDPKKRQIDAVLVLDASLSMLEKKSGADEGGSTKLDAAKAASIRFVNALDYDSGDQASIIGFNEQATLHYRLGADRRKLVEAVERIEVRPQTCILCGLIAAHEELGSVRGRVNNRAVVLLLTDGRSNPQPADQVVDKAAELKNSTIAIYAVGLGDNVDERVLRDVASEEEYYHAPTADRLDRIYQELSVEARCPRRQYWGRR